MRCQVADFGVDLLDTISGILQPLHDDRLFEIRKYFALRAITDENRLTMQAALLPVQTNIGIGVGNGEVLEAVIDGQIDRMFQGGVG